MYLRQFGCSAKNITWKIKASLDFYDFRFLLNYKIHKKYSSSELYSFIYKIQQNNLNCTFCFVEITAVNAKAKTF